MNITRLAIENNRTTYTLMILVLISGLMAYKNMSRSQDPGFIIRTAMIITYFPGASPERVEKLVTDKLESAIQEMPELDFLQSSSKTGVSILYVNIKENLFDMRPIWDKMRRKVDRERSNLPEGIIGPLVNDEFGDVFGVIVSITGDGYNYAELKDVADQARDELLLKPNVAKVELHGVQDERVFLEYNNSRLAKLGLSPSQFQQILTSQNIVIPGGSVRVDEERIFLEPTGNFESLEDIENSIISLPGRPEVVYLKDIVTVYRDYIDPPSSQMYSSGYPSLGLAISKREGGNIITLGEEVKQVLVRLQESYPIGIEFEIVAFEPEAVEKVINNFTGNLVQSIIIVMVVMILFLGIRTGMVVATLIPATILATFMIMSFFNIGLDKISLAALIISLGLLVDNAIVMSESCMVLIGEGRPPVQAAIDSANELKVPLLTSSLTTAAAFLPIFLAESTTGEYTASLFKVVTIALLSSWIIALTIIPMLCAKFLKVKPQSGDSYNSSFYQFYRWSLTAFLKLRWISLLGVIIVFFISLQGFKYIPSSFFPDSDQPMFTYKLELPKGTAIEETSAMVRQVDAYIAAELLAADNPDGITNWTSYVGEGAPRFYLSYSPQPPSPDLALLLINVSDYRIMRDIIAKLDAFCKEQFPDVKVDGKLLPNGPIVENPIEIRISGRDFARIFDLADQMKDKLKDIPGTFNIDDNWGLRTKKILVDVNQARARRAGLSSQDIAVTLQTSLSGLETTQYREDDKIIPVVLRSGASDRSDLATIENLSVYSRLSGESVPLRQIADISLQWEQPIIKRRDRLPTITVSCKLDQGVTPTQVENAFLPWLDEQAATWPPGYRYELGGENESSKTSQESIGAKLPIAGMIVLLLLVSQFNSIRRPIIILTTLPLGLMGVVVGFLITGASLGFMAFLGIISLSGIVINNAIVLIDRIGLEIKDGHTPPTAILEAAQRRLRPILLTTVTTLAGLTPLWLSQDPMFMPMAVTIIFGLAFATILTLAVVPLLYCLLFNVRYKGYVYKPGVK